MITKYRTDTWKPEIVTIEAERETHSSLWIRGRRRNKSSSYDKFHDSWEEAKAYLLNKAELTVKNCESELDSAKDKISKIKKLETL